MKGLRLLPLAALLFLLSLPEGAADAQAPLVVAFDMDPTGNTASSLGPIDACVSVADGESFQFDVVVDQLALGDDYAGNEYYIVWGPTENPNGVPIFNIAAQQQAVAGVNLITANASSGPYVNTSNAVPDTLSPHKASVADVAGPPGAETNPPYSQGVLGRYTAQVGPGVAPGVYDLDFTRSDGGSNYPPPIIGDSGAADQCVLYTSTGSCTLLDGKSGYGKVAVGVPCPGAPTPTPTPASHFLTRPFDRWPYRITDGWGKYTGDCVPAQFDEKGHWGIDYGTQQWSGNLKCWELPEGTPILAAAAGWAMASSQYSPQTGAGYGKFVLIWHEEGYSTLYAHLKDFAPALKRQECSDKHNCPLDKWVRVKQGQLIGYSGDEGTDYPHLHFEVAKVDQAAQDRYSEHVNHKLDPYDINTLEVLDTPEFKSADQYPDADNTTADCGPNHLWKDCPPPLPNSAIVAALAELIEPFAQRWLPVLVPALARLAVIVTWDGSDVEVTLISPSGRTMACPTDDPGVVCDEDTTFTVITVDTPEVGQWTIGLFGADVPEGGEQVSIVVTGEPLAVGGVLELHGDPTAPSAGASDSPALPYAALAGAAAALAIAAGAWYTRRRWLR